MPKKLNTNPKAEEARQRKDGVKKEKKAGELKAAEDVKWQDEGQSATERRAAEKAQKAAEELKKKEAKKAALAKDAEELKTVKTVKVNPHRVTVANIQAAAAQREKERAAEKEDEDRRRQRLLEQPEPTENVNQAERKRREEDEQRYGKDGVVDARTLDEAVAGLAIVVGGGVEDDRHPEKRMKAAFREYEEKQWEELKKDNPSLRHSQLKDLLFKQWQVSSPPHSPAQSTCARPSPSTLPLTCFLSCSVSLLRKLPRTRWCRRQRESGKRRRRRRRQTTEHRSSCYQPPRSAHCTVHNLYIIQHLINDRASSIPTLQRSP